MDPCSSHPVLFRKDIDLPSAPTAAILQITAHWKYVLYINGRRVSAGPARCYPARQLLDSLDIAGYLHSGKNAFAIYLLCSTGVSGYSIVARPALYLEGRITCGSQAFAVVSDASWLTRVANWISSQGMMTSLATGTQEHHQSADAPANPLTDPVDDLIAPRLLGPAGTPPFLALEPRPIPLLLEEPIPPILVYSGRSSPELLPVADLAKAFNAAPMTGQAVTPATSAHLCLDTRGNNVATLDFGRTRLLYPGFDIRSADPGTRIELYYDIAFDRRPTAMLGFGSEREGFCDSIASPAAGCHFSTLQPRGARFVTLKLSGSGCCDLRLTCNSVDYPFPEALPYHTADRILLRIWQTSCDTLRSAASDVFVDTCARENVLWTLDACLAGKAAYYSFGETALWRRCLLLIAQGIDAQGIPHAVVPSHDSFMVLFDQALYFVLSCRDYLELTGDTAFAEEIRPAVVRLLSRCLAHITTEDLFVPPAYSWHFVDWAPIPKRAYSFPINAMLLLALEAAQSLLKGTPAAQFRNASGRLRQALLRFWDDSEGCYRNHLEPRIEVGPESTFNAGDPNTALPFGLHANALSLHARLGTPAQQGSAAAWMRCALSQPLGPANRFGPGWTELILSPLFATGSGQQAVDFIKRVYGQVLDAGAPTWPENFSPQTHNTAHGWGSIVNVLLARFCQGRVPVPTTYRGKEALSNAKERLTQPCPAKATVDAATNVC